MDKLTLEDAAKLAGVHRSTVSRVIINSLHVSPEVPKRVKSYGAVSSRKAVTHASGAFQLIATSLVE